MASNYRAHYLGENEKSRIEIIPMIDVMMFLLIFFVLIMLEMIQNAGISVDVPQSTTAQKLESTQVSIAVDSTGLFFVDGRQLNEAELLQKLQAAKNDKDVGVVISGDQNTSYQNVVKAMDIARSIGITAIGLTTKE